MAPAAVSFAAAAAAPAIPSLTPALPAVKISEPKLSTTKPKVTVNSAPLAAPFSGSNSRSNSEPTTTAKKDTAAAASDSRLSEGKAGSAPSRACRRLASPGSGLSTSISAAYRPSTPFLRASFSDSSIAAASSELAAASSSDERVSSPIFFFFLFISATSGQACFSRTSVACPLPWSMPCKTTLYRSTSERLPSALSSKLPSPSSSLVARDTCHETVDAGRLRG
mmetsp:Transcript_15731/g.36638  ORF Transcript_15731/g.36638 Transcript_15731/m.36638 type:complete len:224 (+) Transcript_15731:292-963(+)